MGNIFKQRQVRSFGKRGLAAVACIFGVSLQLMGQVRADDTHPKMLAIVHVQVVDVEHGIVSPDQTVIVKGNRIFDLGPSGNLHLPDGAQLLDGSKEFLMPGLWDMHTHLSFAGEASLLKLVLSGVTGIRDLGGDIWQIDRWRAEIAAGHRVGPRIYRAGPMVDGPNPGADYVMTVNDAHQAACAVDLLKFGFKTDLIKVHDPMGRDAFFGAAKQAQEDQIPLACHLPSSVTAEEASSAGCKSLEHMAESLMASFLYGPHPAKSVEAAAEALVSDSGRELFRVLIQNHTWVTPTLREYQEFASEGEDADTVGRRQAVLRKLMQATSIMNAMGVKLLAGTDFADPAYVLQPGRSLGEELRLLVDAGLSPLEALQTATINPARFLEATDDFGTVSKGRVADLVLLDANPLRDIGNIEKIRTVILDGTVIGVNSKN